MVIPSAALTPCAVLVRPEESELEEAESQLEFELALHVSVDPVAPELLTCTCPVAELPEDALNEMDASVELFTAMFAIGSQRIT
jgi:hypothetical protein